MGLVRIHNLWGWLAGAKEKFGSHCGGGVWRRRPVASLGGRRFPLRRSTPRPRVIKGVGLGVGVQPAFTSAAPILRGIPLRCTGIYVSGHNYMGKLPRGWYYTGIIA